jgi:cystathionine beta-lyase/cystathionine gamma-synthase
MKQHPKVEKVIFPFDESFPQYKLAQQQMKDAGGLFTFTLKAKKRTDIVKFCESLKHILIAVSWGGHESLILPKCAGIKASDFDENNPEHRYIRMYVGLEEAGYLIKDLEQAFQSL